MPYQQKAPCRLRRHIITYQDVCRANDQTIAEMVKLGLWRESLEDVNVYWVPASWSYYGWYLGHIYIPALAGAQMTDLLAGNHTTLRDILRHEWAHALAEHAPNFIETPLFKRIFGNHYEHPSPVRDYDAAHHVTRYATTLTCEDFVEVFHHYLRHKGRLPIRLAGKPSIVKKWHFIAAMASS